MSEVTDQTCQSYESEGLSYKLTGAPLLGLDKSVCHDISVPCFSFCGISDISFCLRSTFGSQQFSLATT